MWVHAAGTRSALQVNSAHPQSALKALGQLQAGIGGKAPAEQRHSQQFSPQELIGALGSSFSSLWRVEPRHCKNTLVQ